MRHFFLAGLVLAAALLGCNGGAAPINTPAPSVTLNQPTGGCPTLAPIGQNYSCQLTATGGLAPYTFSLANNTSFEPGLSMTAAGLISGQATTVGSYTTQVQACDSEKVPVCSVAVTIDPETPKPSTRH